MQTNVFQHLIFVMSNTKLHQNKPTNDPTDCVTTEQHDNGNRVSVTHKFKVSNTIIYCTLMQFKLSDGWWQTMRQSEGEVSCEQKSVQIM